MARLSLTKPATTATTPGRHACALASMLSLAATSLACAHVVSETKIEVSERPGTEPLILGLGELVVERRIAARWMQAGPELLAELEIHQRCRSLRWQPVLREEHIIRRDPEYTPAWEFGIAALTGGFSVVGFLAPSRFGGETVDANGIRQTNPAAGYTTGGVFAGIAAISLIAGTIDAVRLRDEHHYAEAYRPEVGEEIACAAPVRRPFRQPISLEIQGHSRQVVTDDEGRVRIRLPAPRPAQAHVVTGALVLDRNLAVQIDFVVPYDTPEAHGHTGEVFVGPWSTEAPRSPAPTGDRDPMHAAPTGNDFSDFADESEADARTPDDAAGSDSRTHSP